MRWIGRCGETRTRGAAGGPCFPQSSGELKALRAEHKGRRVLWVIRVLGFAGTGCVVLLGGGLQELAGDGGVSDGGVVADAEHGGEVQWVAVVGEGFLELPVDAEAFEGGGEAAAAFGQPVLA